MGRKLGMVGGLELLLASGGSVGYSFPGSVGSWLGFAGPAVCGAVPGPGSRGGRIGSVAREISSGPVSAFGSKGGALRSSSSICLMS